MGTGIWETASSTPRSGTSPQFQDEVCGAAAPHGCRVAGAGPRAAASAGPFGRPICSHSNDSRALTFGSEPSFSRKGAGQGEDSITASGATHGA